jgi:hypothetical protein
VRIAAVQTASRKSPFVACKAPFVILSIGNVRKLPDHIAICIAFSLTYGLLCQ